MCSVTETCGQERIAEQFQLLREERFLDEFFDKCADAEDEHPYEALSQEELEEIREEVEADLREEAVEIVRGEILEEIQDEVRSDLYAA